MHAKVMTIIICHDKPPDRKWDWSMDDVMPRRDGPDKFEDFEKESVEIGPLKRELDFDLKDVVGFFGSLPIEVLNITRCTARWSWGVIIVRIVSLSSCHHGPKPGIDKPVRIRNNRVHLHWYMYLPFFCICICIVLRLWLISSLYTTIICLPNSLTKKVSWLMIFFQTLHMVSNLQLHHEPSCLGL